MPRRPRAVAPTVSRTEPAPDSEAREGGVQRLSSEVQRAIVTRLAAFQPPSEVREGIKADHDVDVSPSAILYYHPDHSPRLGAEWRELFRATRERVIRDESDIGLAHRAVRLRRLDRLAHKAEQRGSLVLAGKFLEQAARETGGAYTNHHVVSSGDSVRWLCQVLGMPAEEIARAAKELSLAFATDVGGAGPVALPSARDAA